MQAADDDDKFKQRQATGLRKSKSGRFTGKTQKMDARQYTMFIGGCFLMSWGLVVTVLLLRLGIMYTFDTIRQTRQTYVIEGAAEWAKKVASKDVMQAIDVWNIINASIMGLVYREPQDYATLGNVLSPAFETMHSLHSVDFGFTDRTSEVTVTRQKGVDVRKSATFVKSNSGDCFLMGVEACISQEMWGDTPIRPDWYNFGNTLKPGPWGGVIYWAPKPELVVEPADDGGSLISPSIRLVFQTHFPRYKVGGQHVRAIGRITMKVAALSGNTLVDERLGEKGDVYLCDASGAMLAAKRKEDLLTVSNGIVRYKYFWELGSADWAGRVRKAFTGSSVREMASDEDGSLVSIAPLEHPLTRFAIIAVAADWGPFQNPALIGTSAIASIVAPAPYVITGAAAFLFFWAQCFHTMRANDGKVGVENLNPQNKRVSITATMANFTPEGYVNKDDLEPKKGKLKRAMTGKLKKMFTMK